MTGIQRVLSEVDADVYYQRNASMLTGATALFCKRKGRVFVYGAGSNTDFSFRDARMDNFRDRLLFFLGLKIADGVIVQNEFQRECYERVNTAPVRVIPNGVIVPTGCEETDQRLVVWIGGIRRIKQPELFLDLARRVPQGRFVLIGGGSGVQPEFERRIISDAGTIGNLELTGHLLHDDTRKLLGRALVLVNTSRVEGFPNAYLEAWSCGVPVVSFNDVDGLIEKERLGTICRGIDDMEAAIRRALANPGESARMGDRARKLLEERFSARVLGGKYVEFFEELISRNPRARKRMKRPAAT
jgi:glycosyltransferase involved in cell wall biosynthesis